VPRIRIRPEAAGALYRQAEYYARKKTPDTAVRWLVQTRSTCEKLAQDPWIGLRWQSRRHGREVRVATIEGFPRHIVVYFQDGDDVVVVDFTRATRDLARRLGLS
jgi:plasmid stabilization system protein ParE